MKIRRQAYCGGGSRPMDLSNRVDEQIGGRMRSQRLALGMSPEQLARALGATVQQILHWEAGLTRIATFEVDSSFFFATAPPTALMGEAGSKDGISPQPLSGSIAPSDHSRMMRAFVNIRRREFREALVKLVETIAETDAESGKSSTRDASYR
jgi:transcriptional regulator with XRE-family HTH domain